MSARVPSSAGGSDRTRGQTFPTRDNRLCVRRESRGHLHSAKGGAVETGCSDLYGVIHDFTT